MSDLVGNPEDRFSQNEAHLIKGVKYMNSFTCGKKKKKRQKGHFDTFKQIIDRFGYKVLVAFLLLLNQGKPVEKDHICRLSRCDRAVR